MAEVRAEAHVSTAMIWLGEIKEGLCPMSYAGCDHACSKTCGEQDGPLSPLPKTMPT